MLLEVNGAEISCSEIGGGDRTIILIHGLGSNHGIFENLGQALLAAGMRVIAYSLRGHGRSSAQGGYHTSELVSDLVALMESLKIGSATLVGWSLGGNLISEVAASHPNRVENLIFLDSFDTGDPPFLRALARYPAVSSMVDRPSTWNLERWLEHMIATDYADVRDLAPVRAFLEEALTAGPDGGIVIRPTAAIEARYVATFPANGLRPYRSIACPVLALFASNPFGPRRSDFPPKSHALDAWLDEDWLPARADAISRMNSEIRNLNCQEIEGTHNDFFLVSEQEVVGQIKTVVFPC